MADVISLGETQHETERAAIAHLREALPAEYTILHSFWIFRDGQRFEVDLAIVAPHAVYLVDVKGWSGAIEGYQRAWVVPRLGTVYSPLKKLENHAKQLSSALTEWDARLRSVRLPFVGQAILLANPRAAFADRTGVQKDVVTLGAAGAWFQDPRRVPERYRDNRLDARTRQRVVQAISGKALPRTVPLQFREWRVTEELRSDDALREYGGMDVHSGEEVRIRVYRADPFAPPEERAAEANRIRTAYAALHRLQHPNIVRVRAFFPSEDEDGFVLVTAAVPGETFRIRNERRERVPVALLLPTFREVLDALAHAHATAVVHRRLDADAVLLGERVVLTGFDYAKTPRVVGGTIGNQIADELSGPYAAPEALADPAGIGPAADVFSAGVLFYEMLVGARPFDAPTGCGHAGTTFPHPPSALRPDLPAGFDGWLQSLCAARPEDRPAAADARDRLDALVASPAPAAAPAPDAPRPAPGPRKIPLEAEPMPPITEFTIAAARPLPVVLLLDRSGSMTTDGKIEVLNQAVQRMLEQLADEDAGLAEVHVAVITFGGESATLHTPLGAARDVRWTPLKASGKTPMGAALDLAVELIDDRERLPSRAYRPTLVLASDGIPTDDWDGALARLEGSPRASKAFRLALRIGSDADLALLEAFAGPDGQVFTADRVEEIRTFFRYVTMSVTARSRSGTPNTPPEFDETDLDALGF